MRKEKLLFAGKTKVALGLVHVENVQGSICYLVFHEDYSTQLAWSTAPSSSCPFLTFESRKSVVRECLLWRSSWERIIHHQITWIFHALFPGRFIFPVVKFMHEKRNLTLGRWPWERNNLMACPFLLMENINFNSKVSGRWLSLSVTLIRSLINLPLSAIPVEVSPSWCRIKPPMPWLCGGVRRSSTGTSLTCSSTGTKATANISHS